MILFNHIYILGREELRELLFRVRSLLSLLLYIGIFLLAIRGFVEADKRVGEAMGQDDRIAEMLAQLIYKLQFFQSDDLAREAMSWPLVFPLFQFLVLIWLPTFVAIVSCDMISSDISRGTLRYVMTRTSRTAYFLSKLISHFIMYLVLQTLIYLLLLGGVLLFSDRITFEQAWRPILTYMVVFVPYLFFLVATTQFISALSRKSFSAILKVHLLWLVFMIMMVQWSDGPLTWRHFLGIVLPFGTLGQESLIAFGLWGIGFVLVGLFFFKRRAI